MSHLIDFEQWSAIRQAANEMFAALPGFREVAVVPMISVTIVMDNVENMRARGVFTVEKALQDRFPRIEFYFDVSAEAPAKP